MQQVDHGVTINVDSGVILVRCRHSVTGVVTRYRVVFVVTGTLLWVESTVQTLLTSTVTLSTTHIQVQYQVLGVHHSLEVVRNVVLVTLLVVATVTHYSQAVVDLPQVLRARTVGEVSVQVD